MNKKKICVITFPVVKRGAKPINQLLEILKIVSNDVYLISGSLDNQLIEKELKDIKYYKIYHKEERAYFRRIISYIKTQIMISFAIVKFRRNVGTFLFFIGGEGLIIPHFVAKILNRKTVFLLAGYPSRGSYYKKDLFFLVENLISFINLLISNRILVYSPRIIAERKLSFLKNKINVFQRHFITKSEIKYVEISNKKENIGFLGNVVKSKGIHNLFVAFKMLYMQNKNVTLHIGGDGDEFLLKKLRKYAIQNGFQDKVIFYGWIERKEIPYFLSKIKYFLLPSYTEGLPNVILEAMGCGCCVITTPVGGIPDVIEDGVNGIIIKDNTPQSIYEGLQRAKSSNLNKISKNANNTIKFQYTLKKSVENFVSIFEKL